MTHYFDRLAERTRETGSYLCVGLDPQPERHAPEELPGFLIPIVEATAPYAACFKPNLAFFEAHGIPGLLALERVLAAVPSGIPVIGDMKRGDIGSTSRAYARAAFEVWGFDAVTANPYLGFEGIEPFLEYADRGVYVLCRTSAAGAADLQSERLASGLRVFEHVARLVGSRPERLGLVVGATARSEEVAAVRRLAPGASFLVPGVGAQGGDIEAVVAAAGVTPGSIVFNASRSILYPDGQPASPDRAAEAARRLRDRIAAAVR
ncbi:Orotidine 5'-phosphate decarboxylase [bacterium HR29]|jgi:orotidine-5'-phosphate decarboxylase|nr:Orotidine 5'-phosphate decarboxylase [bacterium HR29]